MKRKRVSRAPTWLRRAREWRGGLQLRAAARAQQPAEKLPRIGSIQNFRNENFEAIIQGLREAGYVDGQNMLLETRFYAGMLDRIDIVEICIGLEVNGYLPAEF